MNCAICGEVPEQPVVSTKTGHIFEKRLIAKYIETEGKCPITGEPLELTDLLDVQSNKAVRPRPASATSIPGLLALMQNEWDDLMLETYTLRQHLDQTRQELSHALYQQDASARVVARMMHERDEAREQLKLQRAALAQGAATTVPQTDGGANAIADNASMEVDDGDSETDDREPGKVIPKTLAPEVLEELTETWKALTKSRKKRTLPADLTEATEIASWPKTAQATHSLHKTSPAGITCLAISPANGNLSVTGGVDKSVILFNSESGVQEAVMTGHTKKIVDVDFSPNGEYLLSASVDGTAKVWKSDGTLLHTLTDHKGEVTSVTAHPNSNYFATAAKDKSWALYDVQRGHCLRLVKDNAFQGTYECAMWHPDGLILGTGTTDAQIRIWDMKSQKNVASFKGHESGTCINDVAFSENGYYMASGGADGTARLWDLRKLKNFHTITLRDAAGTSPVLVNFDKSGAYFAATSEKTVNVYVVKEWTQTATLGSYNKPITGVAFGPSAQFLAATAMDRTLRFYHAPKSS